MPNQGLDRSIAAPGIPIWSDGRSALYGRHQRPSASPSPSSSRRRQAHREASSHRTSRSPQGQTSISLTLREVACDLLASFSGPYRPVGSSGGRSHRCLPVLWRRRYILGFSRSPTHHRRARSLSCLGNADCSKHCSCNRVDVHRHDSVDRYRRRRSIVCVIFRVGLDPLEQVRSTD